MLRRVLNVASIICLVVCVALMGMWVRSYRTLSDELHTCWPAGRDMLGFLIFSTEGELILYEGRLSFTGSPNANHWPWIVFRGADDSHLEFSMTSQPQLVGNNFGFGYVRSSSATGLLLPYWFLVLASGLLAIGLRLKSATRFQLRTLLIVTTLLAVVLGMCAWLDRAWIGK
jgi:hypothetical protein